MSRISAVSEVDRDLEVGSLAYHVCPVCRFTFKFLRNELQSGVVCPGCDHLLRIDGSSDQIVRSSHQTAKEFDELKVPSWEKSSETHNVEGSSLLGQVVSTLTILGVVALTVWAGWKVMQPASNPSGHDLSPKHDDGDVLPVVTVSSTKEAKLLVEKAFSSPSAKLAKQYFRLDGDLSEHYDEFYKKSPWAVNNSLYGDGELSTNGKIVTFGYKGSRGNAECFVKVDGGEIGIDWLSFVGGVQQDLEGFSKVDSDVAKEFRLLVSQCDNYDFSQTEEEWYNVQFRTIDSSKVYYGYVQRSNRGEFSQLSGLVDQGTAKLILEIKPIKGETGLNKFIINRVVSKDWLKR